MGIFNIRFFEGAIGAILGAVATIFVFNSRMKKIEQEYLEFRKETHEMFREIRTDIKTLIGRRYGDND